MVSRALLTTPRTSCSVCDEGLRTGPTEPQDHPGGASRSRPEGQSPTGPDRPQARVCGGYGGSGPDLEPPACGNPRESCTVSDEGPDSRPRSPSGTPRMIGGGQATGPGPPGTTPRRGWRRTRRGGLRVCDSPARPFTGGGSGSRGGGHFRVTLRSCPTSSDTTRSGGTARASAGGPRAPGARGSRSRTRCSSRRRPLGVSTSCTRPVWTGRRRRRGGDPGWARDRPRAAGPARGRCGGPDHRVAVRFVRSTLAV